MRPSRHLLDKGLLEYAQEVADVGDRAGKEFGLEKTLAKMKGPCRSCAKFLV